MERQRRAKHFPPSFDATSMPGTVEAVAGHPIKLSVKVLGNPRPQVKWQIGRKRVKPSTKYMVDQDDLGLCTLVVNKTHKTLEEGVWAVATNDLGEDCCMIEVRVIEQENSGEEIDAPRSTLVNSKRTEGTQQSSSQRWKDKIETENARGKSGLVFGLQAKKKKTFSLSKSFELDDDKAGKASKIDRSMIGEFNFFRETSIRNPSYLAKNSQEAARASPPHVPAPRLLHKPPPLPARTKKSSPEITNKVQDRRKPRQNRWKKGDFSSNSFIATSSEVEINEEEDDEDEEPMEAVRLTRRKKKKLSSVNASFESSLSSVNSICLETNFDDCAPKLTEEKDSWQFETEFSSDSFPKGEDDKLEADVIAQMEKETKTSSSGSEDSDFQMEAYCESPRRSRHSFKIDSQIKTSPILQLPSPKQEVDGAAQPPFNPGQAHIHEIFPNKIISVENSPSASNDENDDDDGDDDEEEEEEEEGEEEEEKEDEIEEGVEKGEGEKIDKVESKETAEIPTGEVRVEVSTDEETREDSGSVKADESTHSSYSGSELDVERENESLESSVEKETSDDDYYQEDCNIGDEDSHHLSDVNNNDDDNNNNNNKGNSSPVKSPSIQFIDSDESEEEWPEPPSAEILESLLSRPLLLSKKPDKSNNAYSNNPTTAPNNPTAAHKHSQTQAGFNTLKEHDHRESNSSADFYPPATKADVRQSAILHTSLSSTHENKSPTYRDAILGRAGVLGLSSSLAGLKGYMAGVAFKKVEFKVSQLEGKENEGQSSCGNKTTAGEMKSSLKLESEIDGNYKKGEQFERNEDTDLNTSPRQFEEPGKNHMEDKNGKRSCEKKSVRFLDDDPKLADSETSTHRNPFKTIVEAEEHVCRPSQASYTSSRWHDPTTNTRQFFSTGMPTQINGEKQTMRLAFDERHTKREASPNEDGRTSSATVHEYGELISFSPPFFEGRQKTDTLDELAEQTINEVVTNKCSVREAVKNILKNRKDSSEGAFDNLWSHSNDRVRLPDNFERGLGNYPMFLSDAQRHERLFRRGMAVSHARLHPGINNTSVKLPEPHFV